MGRTGLRVSRVGCGGGGIDQVWGPTTEAESVRTTHRALELGVNFFAMAPGYGHGKAEEVLGRALHGRQEPVVVATQVRLAAEEMHDAARAQTLGFLLEDPIRTLLQAAMVFCLMNRDIATTVPGLKNAAEIEELVGCVTLPPIPPPHLTRLRELNVRGFRGSNITARPDRYRDSTPHIGQGCLLGAGEGWCSCTAPWRAGSGCGSDSQTVGS